MGTSRWVVGPVACRSTDCSRPPHVCPVATAVAVAENCQPGVSNATSTSAGLPMSGGTSGGRPSAQLLPLPDCQQDVQIGRTRSRPAPLTCSGGGGGPGCGIRAVPGPAAMSGAASAAAGDVVWSTVVVSWAAFPGLGLAGGAA